MFGALSLGMGLGRTRRSPFADHDFALDFKRGVYRSGGGIATSPDALPGYSFARTGASYEIGADGLPLLIPSGALPIVPGVGYWARGSVTQMAKQSNNVLAADWFSDNNIKSVGDIGPLGLSNCCRVRENSGTNTHLLQQILTGWSPSTSYVQQWIVKSTTTRWVQAVVNDGISQYYANFDIIDALVGNKHASVDADIRRIGSTSFCLISIKITISPSATQLLARLYSSRVTGNINSAGPSYLGDGASWIDVWYGSCFASTLHSLPLIMSTGSQATVTAADMRFTQPIPADEDFAFWATCDFKGVPVSGVFQRLATYSNGTSAERLMLERTDVGILSLVSVNSGVFTSLTGGSAAGTGRVTVLFRRNGGAIKAGGKNSSGVVTLGSSTALALPTGLNRLDIGNTLGVTYANAPIEFFGFRRGTFSDAAITAILEAA